MKLTISLATRGRAEQLTATLNSILANTEEPETVVMVAADEDDTETIDAVKRVKLDLPGIRVKLSIAPRPDAIAEKWNRAITEAPADVYLPTVDNRTILTKGFDTRILNAASIFPDGIGCVYFPMANASFPALQCPTAGLVAKLGYIYPEYFPFWFVDHWLDDICQLIDRIVMVNIDSHCEPHKTRGLRDLVFWTSFFDAGQLHRRAVAHSIVMDDDFRDEQWRKHMILSRHSKIENYSLHINEGVRGMAYQIEQNSSNLEGEDNERYQRIVARAKSMLHRVVDEAEAA